MNIAGIQGYLKEHEIHGWLMADFHGRNDIAMDLIGVDGFLTRRSFFFIPAEGEPVALVHSIELDKFEKIQAKIKPFSNYRTLESELKSILAGCRRIAMEYSPMGRLPYIGLVDAGTIDFVRGTGVEVISSADLVAKFLACLSAEQITSHRKAAANLATIVEGAHQYIVEAISGNKAISEFDVQQQILASFEECDMENDHGPICAVDAHAGNPHYEPTQDQSTRIEKNQLILIDLWAKMKSEDAAFADITVMAYSGTEKEIPQKYSDIFSVLVEARDTAVDFVREHIANREVYGYEVDDACRAVIEKAGYGKFFIHRTGHSITSSVHGAGPNIDNLETEDRRQLQEGHLFSIEPGIYLPDCGFRTELDVLIGLNGCEVTTMPVQKKIKALF